MMRLARRSPAHEEGEGGDIFEVRAVPDTPWDANCERTLVYDARGGGLCSVLSCELGALRFEYRRKHAHKMHALSDDQIGPVGLKGLHQSRILVPERS